ncbi:MAG: SPOR domain-containing protein [Ferruginibacter sp.]|nr:SPOR domain-containing protein [Ferruginibacter sp.]
MKNSFVILLLTFLWLNTNAQDIAIDSIKEQGKVTVIRDARIDVLGKKQYELNTAKPSLGPRAAKGFRLMVISSNDRDLAMKVRAQLLQRFPEQKVYMAFQAPYIKIKFGNFVEKGDADRYKKMIKQAGIVSTNIYLVPETVEVKPEKDKEKDDD